ncbi:MAG: plasmid partitioning protein RepB [Bacteroidota bacterium]
MGSDMSKKRSIVSSFGDFRSNQEAVQPAESSTRADDRPKPSRVSAGIVASTQRTMTQIREERDALLEQANSSRQVLSLGPALIEPSPFRDRLPDDSIDDFAALKLSLKNDGQKVPITVRSHPTRPGHYQIVYGHRRWRALKEIGSTVDAILIDYSDRDLVIAQGLENASRQDLSWIERALFSAEMSAAGLKPKDVKSALGIDDAELSKFRKVLKAIPKELIELIGRAPSVGRPRWLELSEMARGKREAATLLQTLSADKVTELPSDERFTLAMVSLLKTEATQRVHKSRASLQLGDVGSMTVTKREVKISISSQHREGFSKFLEDEIATLVERYMETLER